MKLFLSILFIGLLVMNMSYSQDYNEGEIIIVQDSRIDTLVMMHQKINASLHKNLNDDGIDGYRIQIFFDSGNNSKSRATEVLETFAEKYPKMGAYISFREPYYRIRIGDFRTKMEALGFLERILRYYPNAWIIRDKINFPILEESSYYKLNTPGL